MDFIDAHPQQRHSEGNHRTAVVVGFSYRPNVLSRILRIVLIALCVGGSSSARAQIAETPAQQPPGADRSGTLQRQIEEYTAARRVFEEQSSAYWLQVANKRSARLAKRRLNQPVTKDDYVLDQPPVYVGPKQPPLPAEKEKEAAGAPKKPVPVVADFLRAAVEKYKFTPDLPSSELDYKRAYAKAAFAAGVTKDQLLAVYILETGGISGYDTQAGLEVKKPSARAVSTALGYNQLLDGNSVEFLDEQGDKFVASLTKSASDARGIVNQRIEKKLPIVKRMIQFARLVPSDWNDHDRWIGHRALALTPEGLAIHSLNLDVDAGPLLQIQKLVDSVNFAKQRGFPRPMTGSELELLNLMGDPSGYDAIANSQELREIIPATNFFDASGYNSNAIVRDKTIATLLAAIDSHVKEGSDLPGAKQLREALK